MTLVTLAARNVLRNKFRAVATMAGVAVFIVMFLVLRSFVYAWTIGVDAAAKDRVVTRNKVTFVMPLPKRYVQQVRGAPHVKMATYANWFGAKDPKHDHEFFATFAVDPETYFKVYDDAYVPPDQMDAWLHDKQGAIVGDALAKKLGWKIGDKIVLQSGIYPREGDWEFHVSGIYEARSKALDRSSFIFNYNYLADDPNVARRLDKVGWIVSRVDDPAHSADIGVALDKLFDDQDIQTESQDERSFNQSFLAGVSAVLTAIDVLSLVMLAIVMLILGNTIAMGVRERTNEYGVLKALGFTGGHVATFILVEAAIVGVCGGAAGLGFGYVFIKYGIGRFLEENVGSIFPYFPIDPRAGIAALVLSLVLAAAAAALPALRASRLKVVDALRRVA